MCATPPMRPRPRARHSPVVEDLGADHPWERSDGKAVGDDEEIDHDGHGDTRGRDGLCILVGQVRVEDGADDPQKHAHQANPDEEWLLSAEAIHTLPDEETGGNNLDDSVDSAGQQPSLLSAQSDGLENDRSIVRDRVLSSLRQPLR